MCRGGKSGLQPHVDAAPPQRAQRPLAEPLIQLGQDPAGRLHQHPAQLGWVQRRVEPHRLVGERLQFGQRLDQQAQTWLRCRIPEPGELACGRLAASLRRSSVGGQGQ